MNKTSCIQAYGSESLYGSYFGAGDTIGVLLDMDRGTLAFIKARPLPPSLVPIYVSLFI